MEAKKIQVGNLDIYFVQQQKFKTITTGVMFLTDLKSEGIAERAVLSQLLTKSSATYPNEQTFSIYLKDLYNMAFVGFPTRVGKVAVLHYTTNCINDKYLKEPIALFEKSVQLLTDTLLHPAFDKAKLEMEKQLLLQDIRSIYNNKAQYANQMFIKTMFPDESIHLSMNGDEATVQNLTLAKIKAEYEKLKRYPRVFYVMGDISEAEVIAAFSKVAFPDVSPQELSFLDTETKPMEHVNTVIEEQEINQSIVCLGYRSEIRIFDPYYNGMYLLNGMLGQFFHSSLFQEIREKHSLAYYVGSDYNPRKGNFAIVAAINAKEYDLVLSLIADTIRAYQAGDIDDENMELTKKAFINELLKADDTENASLQNIIQQLSHGSVSSMEEKIAKIKSITKEEVQQAAKALKLDTIFFLKGIL